IVAEPALDALTRDVRPGLVALFAAGLLLLVMAVANLASLELARATTRYREIAIRSALGAGPRRVVQQLVLEQLLLAAAGGALGLALAVVLHRALPAMLPADFPRIHEIAFGMPVVLVAFAIAASTGVVMGVLPAWHLRRLRLTQALGEGAAGAVGGTRTRARAWIMTGQIATASTLLVVALLLGRSFVAMLEHDRGFDPAHLITARLTLPDFAFTAAARIEAVEQFVGRARASRRACRRGHDGTAAVGLGEHHGLRHAVGPSTGRRAGSRARGPIRGHRRLHPGPRPAAARRPRLPPRRRLA